MFYPVITTIILIDLFKSFFKQDDAHTKRKAQKGTNIKTSSVYLKELATKFISLIKLERMDIFHERLNQEGKICIWSKSSDSLKRIGVLVDNNCKKAPTRISLGYNNNTNKIQFKYDGQISDDDSVDFDCLWHSSEFAEVIKIIFDRLYLTNVFVIRKKQYYDGQYYYSIYLEYNKK